MSDCVGWYITTAVCLEMRRLAIDRPAVGYLVGESENGIVF